MPYGVRNAPGKACHCQECIGQYLPVLLRCGWYLPVSGIHRLILFGIRNAVTHTFRYQESRSWCLRYQESCNSHLSVSGKPQLMPPISGHGRHLIWSYKNGKCIPKHFPETIPGGRILKHWPEDVSRNRIRKLCPAACLIHKQARSNSNRFRHTNPLFYNIEYTITNRYRQTSFSLIFHVFKLAHQLYGLNSLFTARIWYVWPHIGHDIPRLQWIS